MEDTFLNPHGGNIYKASEIYGFEKDAFLDYSANINPLGIPEALKKIIFADLDNISKYPDPYCTSLRSDISEYLKISEDNIIIGNGASEVIFLLFDVLKPKRVVIPAPSFSEYAKAVKSCGAEIKYFQIKEADGFRLNVDELLESIEEEDDCVILCNPNNPTSKLVPKPDLLRLLKESGQKGLNVIIDEAFIELTEAGSSNSMLEFIKEYPNLFIIRAFTKLFAIPGLRLGYGIGNYELVREMWEKKTPWSVNSLASSVGEFLKTSEDYLNRTSEWLIREKEWFYNELKKIIGLKVFKPETNFVLIKITDNHITSEFLREALARKGVLIRNAANFMFLDNKFFRVAVKDRERNMKFLKLLWEVMEKEE